MEKQLIYEPMTVFTDLLITVFAVYFARELSEWYHIRFMNTHWHWGKAFWALAVGAFLGAISHGIGPHLPQEVRDWIWKLTTVSIGFVSFFFILAAFHHVFPFRTVYWLRWIPVIFMVVYLAIILRDPRFANVIKFYAPAMLFVMTVMLYSQFALHTTGAGQITLGILISFAAAGIQVSGFDLHKHFNHNDLYHVVQIVGMVFIYRGAILLTDFGVE